MSGVQLIDATKVYEADPQRPAIDHVSVEIPKGQFTSVMGPSGSGKSTLLNLVAGIDRPTSGSVVVGGEDLRRLNESGLARFRRRQIGFVFQFFNLLPTLTALENVALPAQMGGRGGADAIHRARKLLARLEVAHKQDRYPDQLSGGESQRVAIARALINDPFIILADEPTGALDSANGEAVIDLLSELHHEGRTVILVTHDAVLASQAEVVLHLRDGRLIDESRLEKPIDAAVKPRLGVV